MEDLARKTLLYDFYGELLTKRQREVYEEYYLNDLSLGEIAEKLQISRAAVHDNVRRSEKSMNSFEERLGLIQHYLDNRLLLQKIKKLTLKEDAPKALEEIHTLVDEVLKNL